MNRLLRKAQKIWGRVEAITLLIGLPAALLIWAYSNFATASQLSDTKEDISAAKAELRSYVDQRHEEVTRVLMDIKEEQKVQRQLQERILLRVSH